MVGEDEFWLPYDIIINILKRVPVKSLIQFKCVSKFWKKIIETPHFIAEHLSHSTSNNAFLLLHRIPCSRLYRTSPFCLMDPEDPDFKIHDLQSLDFTSPTVDTVGVCNGLVLIKDINDHEKLSLWNPATTQVNEVTGTLIGLSNYYIRIGFGFCPIVKDYKIVRISALELLYSEDVMVNQAEVYSLTTGCWRKINTVNLQNLYLNTSCVTANGAMFWLAFMNSASDCEFVVSFDIGHEKFTLLKAPPFPSLSCFYGNILAIHNNKLANVHHFAMENFECCIDLWVMEDANACEAGEGWIKKCSFRHSSRMLYPLCIWRDEIICREVWREKRDYCITTTVMSLINPYNNELKNMPADLYYFTIFNYAESLVPVINIRHQL